MNISDEELVRFILKCVWMAVVHVLAFCFLAEHVWRMVKI